MLSVLLFLSFSWASLEQKPFGSHHLYILKNKKGMEVQLTDFGATVVAIKVPDKLGKPRDVALGYSSSEEYLKDTAYLGSTVGRYANRIAKGEFSLNGKAYKLAKNNGGNSLHGGIKGFNKAIWRATNLKNQDEPSIIFEHQSPDGDEGFPGKLDVKVQFTLTQKSELKIQYSAVSDKDTVVNLTNHTYFNLAGEGNGDILNHKIMINADHFTPVDESLIPTGEINPVNASVFDLRKPRAIKEGIDKDDPQIKLGKGYDHNWVLRKLKSSDPQIAAQVSDCSSGIDLEVWTTEPGIQFYTGNFLDGSKTGKSGQAYKRRSGFCLETQHFPDSPNKPKFPSATLKAGKAFKSTTVYKFSNQGKACR